MLALSAFSLGHFLVQAVQDPSLVAAPQRTDQNALWSITGYPVHNDIFSKLLQAGNYQIQIFFLLQCTEQSFFIIHSKIRILQNMKQLQFDTKDRKSIQITDRIQDILFIFTGQSQNCMYNYRNTTGMQFKNSFLKA